MQDLIYLDHNASTPIAPEVRAAMAPYLEEAFGNPSSIHWAGQPARAALDLARQQVAALLGAATDEIVFTSGGSESNNAAIKGCWFARDPSRNRLVTSAVEHPATSEPCRFLEGLGAVVTVLGVDAFGRVDPDALLPLLGPDIALLTVMHANNEVGTIQPIRALADLAHGVGALVHTDAAQSAGKIPVRAQELGVDLLSLAGHKLYAPKGIGALYVRSGTPLTPLIQGSGHERGRRAGTESVLLAVGLGAACQAALDLREAGDRMREMSTELWEILSGALGERVILQGHPQERLPNTLNVAFVGCVGSEILARCPRLAASTGAACHAGGAELSVTLRAMGVAPEVGAGSVRLSLGRHTSATEVQQAARWLIRACQELSSAS